MLPTTLLAAPAPRVARARIPALEASGVVRQPVRARWIVAATVLVLVAGALGYLRTWPPLATVMSASMAPAIDTGDMVVMKRLDAPAQVGDVVAISVPDDARGRYGYPPVVIHRVVAIAPDGTVRTQGDARKEPDPFTVPHAALTRKVVATAPAGGQVLAFLGSPLGLAWLAGGAVLLLGMPLLDRIKRRGREEDALRSGLERELAASQAQVRELTAALAVLPAQIESAVAAAVAAAGAPPAPAVPPTPPAAGAWDAPPAGLARARGGVLCAAASPPPARRFVRRPMLAPVPA
jgi:signal peptidase I